MLTRVNKKHAISTVKKRFFGMKVRRFFEEFIHSLVRYKQAVMNSLITE